jgi:hypothetical protein
MNKGAKWKKLVQVNERRVKVRRNGDASGREVKGDGTTRTRTAAVSKAFFYLVADYKDS